MRRGFADAWTALAATLVLAACAGSPEPPAPLTADGQARSSYERIAGASNVFLMGDHLGYFGTDDAVERVDVRCLDATCTAAFERPFRSGEASVESSELDLLGERRGVHLVVEEAATDFADVHVYGGWLDHSLFATESVLLKGEIFPDQGATVVVNYAFGFSTGANPDATGGSARWEGLMLGRDMRASPGRGQVVRGEAGVTVAFKESAVAADVEFTGIANVETGAPPERHGVARHGGGERRLCLEERPGRHDPGPVLRPRRGGGRRRFREGRHRGGVRRQACARVSPAGRWRLQGGLT